MNANKTLATNCKIYYKYEVKTTIEEEQCRELLIRYVYSRNGNNIVND